MIKQNFYPGMNDQDIEFYSTNGSDLKFLHNGKIYDFKDLDDKYYQIVKQAMYKDQEVHSVLIEMFPMDEAKQIKKFTLCRFGGLDFNADITSAGKLQKGEYWECPLRGNCKAEGLLCNSIQYNGKVIDAVEIKLIKLLVTDKTNLAIAAELDLPLGTLHLRKRVLYEKLEILTKQELTLFAVRYNLIQIK